MPSNTRHRHFADQLGDRLRKHPEPLVSLLSILGRTARCVRRTRLTARADGSRLARHLRPHPHRARSARSVSVPARLRRPRSAQSPQTSTRLPYGKAGTCIYGSTRSAPIRSWGAWQSRGRRHAGLFTEARQPVPRLGTGRIALAQSATCCSTSYRAQPSRSAGRFCSGAPVCRLLRWPIRGSSRSAPQGRCVMGSAPPRIRGRGSRLGGDSNVSCAQRHADDRRRVTVACGDERRHHRPSCRGGVVELTYRVGHLRSHSARASQVARECAWRPGVVVLDTAEHRLTSCRGVAIVRHRPELSLGARSGICRTIPHEQETLCSGRTFDIAGRARSCASVVRRNFRSEWSPCQADCSRGTVAADPACRAVSRKR